jgi:hypothetical protein
MLKQLKEESRWLNKFASDVTSQSGEDGIISKALDLLPRTGWSIEFGAWDGRKYSNTWNLVSSRGYRGVFIEADLDRFRDLQRTHDGNTNILLNATVGFDEKDCLDAILLPTPVPHDVDILSIDIDGNDYHTWDAIRLFQPKLVVIEYNPTISNSVRFVQPKDPQCTQGSSAASLVELGHSKGYELISSTYHNLLFVSREYYPLFQIPDNCLEVMRDDSHCAQLFVGFDGHVFLTHGHDMGSISLPWHGLKLRESKVQVIPRRIQKFPDNYTLFERVIWRCYFGIEHPRRAWNRFYDLATRCYSSLFR